MSGLVNRIRLQCDWLLRVKLSSLINISSGSPPTAINERLVDLIHAREARIEDQQSSEEIRVLSRVALTRGDICSADTIHHQPRTTPISTLPGPICEIGETHFRNSYYSDSGSFGLQASNIRMLKIRSLYECDDPEAVVA